MIRYSLLFLVVSGLAVLAFRRWFVALCGLLLLTVLTQHPSMPGPFLGVPGLNVWNLLLGIVLLGWWLSRPSEPVSAPAPAWLAALLVGYVALVAITAVRGLIAADSPVMLARGLRTEKFLLDGIANPLKYTLLAVLFFQGAITPQRVRLALVTAAASGLCYGMLMFKSMGSAVFLIDYRSARRATDKLTGLYANDLAEVLGFALCAAPVLLFLLPRLWQRLGWAATWVAAIPPYIALKSRAGFLALAALVLSIGLLRWRSLLLLFPFMVAAVVLFDPSVEERMLTGVGTRRGETDWEAVSAGRVTTLWPPVIAQILRSPLVGYGRYAIAHSAAYEGIVERGAGEGGVPEHPHNAYLEILLDAGLLGLAIVLALLVVIARGGLALLRSPDRLARAAGTVALMGVVIKMATSLSGSSFYITQSSVPYMAVWGTALRVYLARQAAPLGWSVRPRSRLPRLPAFGRHPVP